MTTFHSELRRAVTARMATRPDLVRLTGACSTLVKRWLEGGVYPDHPTVIVLADHLDWPGLVELSVADRTGTCEACGGPTFTTRGSRKPRFCTSRCRRRVSDRVANGRRLTHDRKILRYRLEEHVEAVAAYCRECTGAEHVCRDEECALRPVSPLPLIRLAGLRKIA